MTALNLFIADVYQDQKCLKDKVIPAELVLSRKEYMPAIIKYYLDQEPLLGQVPTYVGLRKDDFAYMRDHLATLVVKTTGDSGGYNMLMGPSPPAGRSTPTPSR